MHALPFAAFLFVAPATLPVTAPVVAPSEATIILPVVDPSAQTPVAPMAAPVEYSDEYKLRAKIHKIGSFAMLPLAIHGLVLGFEGNALDKSETLLGNLEALPHGLIKNMDAYRQVAEDAFTVKT